MTEKSLGWTTGATGDGATAYTQAEFIRWQRQFFVGADNEGVAKDYLNELEVTGTASPVATNTGAAFVHGFAYWNTASVDVAIATPAGNTRIDRIVLRASWAAQTIRITRIAGTEGSGTPPAIVQTDGTTWDIPLAQASITTGGVITMTDERELLHPNIEINTAMLEHSCVIGTKIAANVVDSQHYVDGSIDTVHIGDDQITSPKILDSAIIAGKIATGGVSNTIQIADEIVHDTKIGNRVAVLKRRQGGSATIWSTEGNATYTPGKVRMQAGVKEWTGASALNGIIVLTFPVAFAYAPIILPAALSTGSPYGDINVEVSNTSLTATGCILEWRSITGIYQTSVKFHWLAIGPE